MELLRKRKIISGIVLALFGFFALISAFQIGEFVGVRKAEFSSHWGERYEENFFGPRRNGPKMFGASNFLSPHSVVGQILNVQENVLVVGGQDAEKSVLVTDRTMIRRGREFLSVADLSVGIRIGVIGEPNRDGQIEAQMIRVMP